MGEYHSAFKGQGMTFSEFREYVHGDDVRNISWNLTARTGKAHVKKYDEERELTSFLVVDISGSGEFGTGKYSKSEVIVHLAALLGYSAVKNNDRVGLLTFTDQVEKFVPPKKGVGQIHRILRDLLYEKPLSKKTDLRAALEHLSSSLKKQANIFIISDFIAKDYDKALKLLGKKHDVTALWVYDKKELELPNLGLVEMQDPETEDLHLVDTSSEATRFTYKQHMLRQMEARKNLLRKSEVSLVEIDASENYVDPLIAYFKKRNFNG
jgi:uncharacterized protein (DUF58 family)